MLESIHRRIAELHSDWAVARVSHPIVAYGVVSTFAATALTVLIVSSAFVLTLPKGLPDDSELLRIGEMDQATAVLDASDQLAFTIYKEQRIEVPLTDVSPNLLKALISIEDQRF